MKQDMMNFDEISKKLEDSIAELENESRLNWSGLKTDQDTAAIMKKYESLYSKEVVAFARNLYEKEINHSKQYEYKLVYFALNDLNIYGDLAGISDHINSYFAKSKVIFNDKDIAYYDIRAAIMKETDFDKREELQSKSGAVVSGINAKMLESLEKEMEGLKKAGYLGYMDYFQREKNIDYSMFFKLCERVKNALTALYREKMEILVRDKLGVAWNNIRSCHTIYLMQPGEFDQYFPKGKIISAYKKTLRDMGLLDEESEKIVIDIEDRPSKNPRAVCFTIRVPEEIYLIIKPNGTQDDFEAFMHEAGHCLNYSHIDKDLPFAFRNLSSSHALTELFSYTFESLARNPLWLQRYLGVPEDIANQILYKSELGNLFMLMRYLGKFSYEYKLFDNGKIDRDGPALYSQTLTKFTNFIYDPVQYLNDMDGGFYSADYLRAWIAEAQLLDYLRKNFGEKWFVNKSSGEFFKSLWRPGFQYELEDIIERNGIGREFDIDPLICKFKKVWR